jgi:SAM-dependent methyltransferase
VSGRNRLVWRLLNDALDDAASRTGAVPRVLDCGGGSGSFAVPLAQVGATVTVVDVSADALATLSRRAAEAGVAERVQPVQADVENLADSVPSAAFDLVLAHDILDVVDQLDAALAAMVAAVRPAGVVSVLVANPAASVLARVLSGDLVAALAELRALQPDHDGPDGRMSTAVVGARVQRAGLEIEQVHGVGVFSELVPGAALDSPGAAEALAALEEESSVRSPFSEIAGRVHILGRRPG